ncbi:hypothetical protein LTR37_012884 [Vermiconidia calcicola]|uniref:Uncharacterized protein n=1 Tax=Vermiconidia calcicola TaxID=1690605 RepID=A0ACC3MYQ7_9PEZI|nr:hypothetical protein LTR37_012884 [Vermiconidia calcicola]
MPQLEFVTVDVFTKTRFIGNPLAIVIIPAAQDASTEQCLRIAREFNLSETIFLHEQRTGNDGVPEWRVRIFIAAPAEIPFAGHPTIGAACYALGTLFQATDKGRLICNAGPIEIEYANGVARAAIPHNYHRHSEHEFKPEEVYGTHEVMIRACGKAKAIDIVSPVKGMNFIAIELPDFEALTLEDNALGPQPKPKLDKDWDEGFSGSLFYVITNQSSYSNDGVVKLRTRMIEGAFEDPATGSASCGLCALLAMNLKMSRTTRFELTQGVEMGRKSDVGVLLTLNESMDAVERIELSGSAVKVMEGRLEYEL